MGWRVSVWVVAAVALMVAAGPAFADHGRESAHGTVHKTERLSEFGCFFPTDPTEHCLESVLTFAAHDDGTDAQGHVTYRARDEFRHFDSVGFTGRVDCLEVVGNEAVMSGEVERVRGQLEVSRFMVVAEDGGNPSHGATGDAATLTFGESGMTDPTTCVTPVTAAPFGGQERAVVVVHDDVLAVP